MAWAAWLALDNGFRLKAALVATLNVGGIFVSFQSMQVDSYGALV